MGKSHANGNGPCGAGNSFANGSVLPGWLRHNWEFREVWESRWSIWSFLP